MLVSISTMPAGENYLKYVKQVEQHADFMHLDVCDGKYNETTCFSAEFAKDINFHSTIALDCHLMTCDPILHAKNYIKSGVNIVTAQFEAFKNKADIIDFVHFVTLNNTLVGLSLEPETSVNQILQFLPMLNVVLIMAVKTGKSGQKFDESSVKKIEMLAKLRSEQNLCFKIEVDGGINSNNAKLVKSAGADIVVSGNYVYLSQDKEQAISSLR